MVQNFEVYGVEITVEKPIAVCVACSFCVNIDMAVDKNVKQGYFFLISQKFLKTFQDFFDDFSNDAISIV